MKRKILAVLFFLVPFLVMAQSGGLVEVRGVETRWEKYDLDEPIFSQYNRQDQKFAYGITFTNKNNFSVTIDAELMQKPRYNDRNQDDKLINTKSFVLAPREEYTWKLEFNSYNVQRGAYNDRSSSESPDHYVRFKAFKNL